MQRVKALAEIFGCNSPSLSLSRARAVCVCLCVCVWSVGRSQYSVCPVSFASRDHPRHDYLETARRYGCAAHDRPRSLLTPTTVTRSG